MLQLQALMGDVYASDSARLLMELLAKANEPVRYSEARRRVGAHPQDFQRSVELLESLALMGRRLQSTRANDRYRVLLEATPTGKRVVDLFRSFEAAAHKNKALESALQFPKRLDDAVAAPVG